MLSRPTEALVARATRVGRHQGHGVAAAQPLDVVGQVPHPAADLVAERERHLPAELPAELLGDLAHHGVGVAQAVGGHPDEHLARPGRGTGASANCGPCCQSRMR